ncbi:MAG: NAD(P)-dependent oxidoreductase [Acidobacteriota bacterium]
MARPVQRVAITGATGFIGRYLTAYLLDRGIEVLAVVRPGSPNQAHAGATVVTAPLETTALVDAFSKVDGVVHLAGIVAAIRAADYAAVNVEGTRAVATAAARGAARLVHVSSLAAAGPAPADAPRREEDAPRPITPYGQSKLESERTVEQTPGLRWTILRPGVVYGPGDHGMLPLFRMAARGLLPLVGRRDAAYTFVFVDDMARAAHAALTAEGAAAEGRTCFVGHADPVMAGDVLAALRQALPRRRSIVVPVPGALVRALAHAGDVAGWLSGRPALLNQWRARELFAEGFVCRVDRLRDCLGVTANVGLQDGIARTADWYLREGWL